MVSGSSLPLRNTIPCLWSLALPQKQLTTWTYYLISVPVYMCSFWVCCFYKLYTQLTVAWALDCFPFPKVSFFFSRSKDTLFFTLEKLFFSFLSVKAHFFLMSNTPYHIMEHYQWSYITRNSFPLSWPHIWLIRHILPVEVFQGSHLSYLPQQ